MGLNPVQQHALYVIPMVTGSLSAVGSSIMIYTILRSKKKLTMPHRRIMFGLSVFEVFQSLGICTSIFPSPKDTPNTTWALGNTLSCDLQGLIFAVGTIAVPMYMCSLSIYYLCIIKFNMKKKAFRYVEPCLHIVPIAYSWFCGIYCFLHGYFNNAGPACYVTPKPAICGINPSVECRRGEGATWTRWVLLTYPSMAVFVTILLVMMTIAQTVVAQLRRNRRYLFANSDDAGVSNSAQGNVSVGSLMSRRSSARRNSAPRLDTALKNQQSEIQLQAFLYIGCYLLSYGIVWSQSVYSPLAKKPVPYAVRCILLVLFPSQGVFNILIYCRPHVNLLRKRYPEIFPTWFSAFCKVMQHGGDNPLTHQERHRIMLRRASIDVPKNTTEQSSAAKQSSAKRGENCELHAGASCDNNAAKNGSQIAACASKTKKEVLYKINGEDDSC